MWVLIFLVTMMATGDHAEFTVSTPYNDLIACSEDAPAKTNDLANIVMEHLPEGTEITIQFKCMDNTKPA